MKIEKTYLELIEFHAIANRFLSKNKDNENKLVSSVRSVITKQIKNHFDTYNDELDTIQLNNCAVDDKTKVIILGDGKRQYTIEGQLKLKAEHKTLLNQRVDIHARIAPGIDELITLLTEEEKEAFSGIVIPEQETKE